MSPKTIVTDFEASLLKAIDEFFDQCEISGCSVHALRCFKRQSVKLSIHRYFLKKHHPLQKLWTFIKSLPFLPYDQAQIIRDTVTVIFDEAEESTKASFLNLIAKKGLITKMNVFETFLF